MSGKKGMKWGGLKGGLKGGFKMDIRGFKVPVEDVALSEGQKEVLRLLCEEFFSVKKVALRRGTSVQAVYQIIHKLQEKGFLDAKMQGVQKGGVGIKPPPLKYAEKMIEKRYRLHGQKFRVGLLGKVLVEMKVGSTLSVGSWTVQVWKDCLVLHCGLSFIGSDVDSITGDSLAALEIVLRRLERDLGVCLVKDRAMNIRVLVGHYAEMRNELAVEMEAQGEKIAVKDPKDGKVWLLVDNSFNQHEIETTHPQTAQGDMRDVVARVFNDWREGRVPIPENEHKELMALVFLTHQLASGLASVVEILKPKEQPKEDEPLRKDELGWYIG